MTDETTALVKQIGLRLAKVSAMPNLNWEFRLIKSEQQNAFALPGGKVAVYTGLLPVAMNEAGSSYRDESRNRPCYCQARSTANDPATNPHSGINGNIH